MIDYATILKENPCGVLATHDEGKVRTRVFQCLFSDAQKLYFGTNKEKSVYEQLQANPHVSFCTYPTSLDPVLSLTGTTVFVDDLAIKTRILAAYPLIKDLFKTPDNPLFQVFYIDVAEVTTFSISKYDKKTEII